MQNVYLLLKYNTIIMWFSIHVGHCEQKMLIFEPTLIFSELNSHILLLLLWLVLLSKIFVYVFEIHFEHYLFIRGNDKLLRYNYNDKLISSVVQKKKKQLTKTSSFVYYLMNFINLFVVF